MPLCRKNIQSMKVLDTGARKWYNFFVIEIKYADVAELADAPDLGSGVYDVQVQVLSSAPNSRNPNLLPIGEGFGFLLYLNYSNWNIILVLKNLHTLKSISMCSFFNLMCETQNIRLNSFNITIIFSIT